MRFLYEATACGYFQLWQNNDRVIIVSMNANFLSSSSFLSKSYLANPKLILSRRDIQVCLSVAFVLLLQSALGDAALTLTGPLFFFLGGGGDGGGGDVGIGFASADEAADFGFSPNGVGSYSCSNGVSGFGHAGPTSTPFLKVWNGKEFIYENDFLFGKPGTAFFTKKQGLQAYQKGMGGDTYLLSDALRPDNGKLKLQIREIEPEESYIDSFSLYACDVKPHERLVVDGNLTDAYLFDRETINDNCEHAIYYYHHKTGVFRRVSTTADADGRIRFAKEYVLEKDDALIVRVSLKDAELVGEKYLLVESYDRDWSLGGQVPFTLLEEMGIKIAEWREHSVQSLVGVGILIGSLIGLNGVSSTDKETLASYLTAPKAHADHVVPTTKSLVCSVRVGSKYKHLQTLFPRYIQSTEEVIPVSDDILALSNSVTFAIKATKKHTVRSARFFTAKSRRPELTPLTITKAVRHRNQEDLRENLSKKDGNFTHTRPGDVIDLEILDNSAVPEGHARKYVLKAHGFYTQLSAETSKVIGDGWVEALEAEDRSLLRGLRSFNS